MIALMLGSGPNVTASRDWPRAPFDRIVAINNAHRVRPDWTDHIHPEDFAEDRRPVAGEGRRIVTYRDYVPAMNASGGVVYWGGTMAFTATAWALHDLRPRVIAYLGCDMVYPAGGDTHFYGTGTADPLRDDITLRNLEAKAARAEILAARQGCALVNLSSEESRLTFPRASRTTLENALPRRFDARAVAEAEAREAALDYRAPSGRYWEDAAHFDIAEIDALDALWLAAGATASAAAPEAAGP